VTVLRRQFLRDDLVTEVVLPRLNSEQTAALAAGVSTQKLDIASLEHIYRETDGNPLFVIESVRAGLTSGETLLRHPGDSSGSAQTGGSLPPKVHAVLSARLAQLSPPARELAGIAATVGRAFTFELLVKASRRSEESLAPALDELWKRRLIQRRGEDSFDFSHDKLREVAYAEVGPARQRLLNRWVAEALETISAPDRDAVSSQLARHFEQAGMRARAIPYYHQAAKSSQRVYADNEAIGYLTKALELLKSLPQTTERDHLELELLISLGPSLTVLRGYAAPEAGRIYGRARLLCEFAQAQAQYFPVLWGSWVFHVVRADLQAARELASRFHHLAENQDNPTIRAAGHFTLGCTLFHLGELKQARKHFEGALAHYDPQHYPFLLHAYGPELGVFCLSYLAHVLWILGYADQALERCTSALSRAQELAHPFSVALALDYFALFHQFCGDQPRAADLALQTATLCEKYGFQYYLAWTPIIRGWTQVQTGLAEDGAKEIWQGLNSLEAMEAGLRKPYFLTLLAQASDRAGRLEEGFKLVNDAFVLVEKSRESWSQAELHRTKGDLLLHRGAAREAELSYERALSLARQQEARPFELRAALCLCHLWAQQGKGAQASELLRKTCDKFTEGAGSPDLREATAVLEHLSRRERPLG
jgi:predicted ATPase